MSPALAGGLLSTAPPGKSSALNSFLPHFSCPDSIAYIVPLYGVHSSHWLSIFLSFSFCFFMWILSTDLSSNSLILFSFSFLWSSVVKSLYWTFQITHYVWMLSRLSHVWLFVTLWTVDSSVHGILQARTLEWVAMPSSRGSSGPRDWTRVSYISCICRWLLYHYCQLGSPFIYYSASKYLVSSFKKYWSLLYRVK